METGSEAAIALARVQFERAGNMSDSIAALGALANCDCPERDAALEAFHARWQSEPLAIDKWLAVQAASALPGTLGEVKRLCAHPSFDIRNPNKIYALIRTFCANHARFHAADGAGYAFAADRILEIDARNPPVAARIARAFDRWRHFDAGHQAHARAALERIRDAGTTSKDVLEVACKVLG